MAKVQVRGQTFRATFMVCDRACAARGWSLGIASPGVNLGVDDPDGAD
jgi:hypothetical protein